MADPAALANSLVSQPEPELHEGTVLDDASTVGQEVRCIVPGLDEQLASDPMEWTPYVTDEGVFFPKRGERVVLGFQPDGPPVVQWWKPGDRAPDMLISGIAQATPETPGAVLLSTINARTKGAIGDGVADDTNALLAAIKQAIELGLPLYLPPGDYRITSGLVASSSDFRIFGAGARVSRIVPDASTYHALSIGKGDGPNNGPSGYARDFGIAGGNAETLKTGAAKDTGKAALHLNSMAVFKVDDVRISGAHDIGVDLENNCYGTSFTDLRTEYDACRVAVNLRTGTENGEDILFLNCWLAGEVCSIHATQGKNYRVIGGQLSASRKAAVEEDLRGVVILGKDYLTGGVGFDTAMTLEGASFEFFQQCWAIRAFKQVVLKADASFNASGEEPALGFLKNSGHAASQVILDACLFEGNFSAGEVPMVVLDEEGSGASWGERGSWGSYTDSTGETNASWNNMCHRAEVPRSFGFRDGDIQMCGFYEARVNEGKVQFSDLHEEAWKDVVEL